MTGVIDSGEPCSKNVKVSVSHVESTSNSITVSIVINVRVLIYTSLIALKRVKYVMIMH